MESNPHRPWDALYPVVRGVPDSWRDATVYYAETDLPQLLYQGYRQGLADEKFCMGYFNVWGLDTASRSARPIRSVIAMAAPKLSACDWMSAPRMKFEPMPVESAKGKFV